jgi:hypothetical protein
VCQRGGLALDPKKLPPPKGPRAFLPKRWVVERTFSWLAQNRRMSKDYERLPESAQAFIYVVKRAAYGEAFGSLMRLFRRFLNGVLRSSLPKHSPPGI